MVDPRFRGNPFPNAETWRAIKPASGNTWESNYYSTSDSVLNSTTSPASFTAGVVHLIINHEGPRRAGESERLLLSTGALGTNGYHLSQRSWYSGTPANDVAALFYAAVGSGAFASSYANDIDNAPVTITDSAVPNTQSFLQVTALVVDDDTYPDDGFFINGQKQKQAGASLSWSRTAPSGDTNLYLGRGGSGMASGSYTDDWIIGWFFVEDAMSEEELTILQQNILLAKAIPDVDVIGGGIVPDYIFDVKSQMPLGTSQAPSTWNSVGSGASSKSMSRTGNLDVVEVGAVQSPR